MANFRFRVGGCGCACRCKQCVLASGVPLSRANSIAQNSYLRSRGDVFVEWLPVDASSNQLPLQFGASETGDYAINLTDTNNLGDTQFKSSLISNGLTWVWPYGCDDSARCILSRCSKEGIRARRVATGGIGEGKLTYSYNNSTRVKFDHSSYYGTTTKSVGDVSWDAATTSSRQGSPVGVFGRVFESSCYIDVSVSHTFPTFVFDFDRIKYVAPNGGFVFDDPKCDTATIIFFEDDTPYYPTQHQGYFRLNKNLFAQFRSQEITFDGSAMEPITFYAYKNMPFNSGSVSKIKLVPQFWFTPITYGVVNGDGTNLAIPQTTTSIFGAPDALSASFVNNKLTINPSTIEIMYKINGFLTLYCDYRALDCDDNEFAANSTPENTLYDYDYGTFPDLMQESMSSCYEALKASAFATNELPDFACSLGVVQRAIFENRIYPAGETPYVPYCE